jgi:hypothetical protein
VRIQFTSTLTPEDENRVAPAILSSVARLLELLPIAYSLQIQTSDGELYQHNTQDRPRPTPIDEPRSKLGRDN